MPSRLRSLSLILPFLLVPAAAGLVTAGEVTGPSPVGAPGEARLPSATRGPVQIAFTPDGTRALVTEADTATLAVVDAETGALVRRIPTGGSRPEGLAPDSATSVLVTNAYSGSVARLDLTSGKELGRLRLAGQPVAVAVSPDRKHAFVSLSQLDEVAVLALPELTVETRIAVGNRPRALALTPDGTILLVANARSGDVSLIDTASLKEARRVQLRGQNFRGLTLTADGKTAYLTGQVPAETRVTWMANDVWVNTLFRLDLASGGTPAVSDGRLDQVIKAAPDPDGVAALPDGRVALVMSGSDEAMLVGGTEPSGAYFTPAIEQRTSVGAHPRGLAMEPGGKRLWVADELGNTLTVLESVTLRPVRKIELGMPEKADPALAGRYLFGHNSFTAGGQFTCNSCHVEGGSDGLAWEFVHVPDDLPARNTRSLRGGVTTTAPFRWSGREREVEVFLQDEISGLMHGGKQSPERLHAVRVALERMPEPANPYREEDGTLTAAGERGKALFEGKAGCVSCHAGSQRGGTGVQANVGTSSGRTLDVPHLRGVYDSAPYLHDARAKSLEEIFGRLNKQGKHGQAHTLTSEELKDLLRYVREL